MVLVRSILLVAALFAPAFSLRAAANFSGKWVLDQAASRTRAFASVELEMTISQNDRTIQVSSTGVTWSYALDGSETRAHSGDETWNSAVKWEGAALLINTLVSGPRNYTVADRWELSPDRNTLTVSRQVLNGSTETEGTLVFRREGTANRDLPPAASAQPGFARRAEPGVPPDLTVPAGTHVLLALIGEINTKHAREGDHVYLRTDVPVAVGGRVVIPRGSDVAGTITRTRPAGKVSGKGELFLRYDSLTLPNGTSRDFHARPPGAEGQVPNNGRSADPHTVLMGTGIGAGVGAIAKGLPGAGVGGAAGALAGVLLSRNQDIVLRSGTHLEMVLDRDLVFHPDEVR